MLDELREAFRWAVRNDKLGCGDARAADAPPAPPQMEFDEAHRRTIADAVEEHVRDLGGDVYP